MIPFDRLGRFHVPKRKPGEEPMGSVTPKGAMVRFNAPEASVEDCASDN